MLSGGETDSGAELLDTDEKVLLGAKLREAAGRGVWSAVSTLLNEGAPVDLQDHADGRTALMRTEKIEVAELLLDWGANVHLKDKSGRTALMITSHKDMAALLIQYRAKDDTVELASMRGYLHMSQMAEDVEILAAAGRGDIGSVRRFLERGVSVDLQGEGGKTALMCTTDEETAGLLLERGADVNLQDSLGRTALTLTEDKDMEELLISWGAKHTVLVAEQRGGLEAVGRYLDKGGSVDAKEWQQLVGNLGWKDMMALLLRRGAPVNIHRLEVDAQERSKLQLAAQTGGLKAVGRYLDKGGSVGKLSRKDSMSLVRFRGASEAKDALVAKDALPTNALVLAVAAELDEEQFGKVVAGLTAPPKESHEAFSTLVHWIEEADKRARDLRSADPRSADKHADLFVRLQLAAAAFLEDLPGDVSEISETEETDKKVQKLLCKEECVTALNTALRVNAKELFAQPVMQRYVEHVWLGQDLQEELTTMSKDWKKAFSFKELYRRTKLVLLLLVNLLLLPVVALVPPLDTRLKAAAADATAAKKEAKIEVKEKPATRAATAWAKVAESQAEKSDGEESTAEESAAAKATNLYVLQLPLVKFYLSFTAQLALALTFTLLPAETMHDTTAVSLLLLWMVSSIVWEAEQARGNVRGHFADYFNRYDLAALVLCTATLLMAAATVHNWDVDNEGPDEYWASTRALAILFLWLRTLRVLLVSPTFGPYALMFNRMLFGDVLYFLVLLGFLLVGIGAAWYALLKSTTYSYSGLSVPGEPWREYSPAAVIEAEGCADELGGIDLITIIFRLLEGALTGSDFFDCARSSTEAPFASWVLSFVFVLLTVVLLLNMLIAMCGTCASNTCPHSAHVTLFLCCHRMSKTFDNIAEAASTNYLFLKAQMTLSLAQEPPTPPPLYVLSFPSLLLRLALWVVKRLAPEGSGLHDWASGSRLYKWATETFHKWATDTTALSESSISRGVNSETLATAVTKYILDHQADVAQEERWRTTMQRKMDKNFRSIKDIQESVNKGFEELVKKEMKANRDKMDKHFKDLRVELGIGVVTSDGVVAAVAAV